MRTAELRFVLAVGFVVVAVSAAGCGGSGESRLTKVQFIRQGDAICREAAAEQAKLAAQHKGEVVSGNFEAVTAVFVPPMERELHRLRVLSPPRADEKQVRAILKATASGVEDAKADYLDLFVQETDPFAEANALARGYGLAACAESPHAVVKPHGDM
jgi:hypothetical protein